MLRSPGTPRTTATLVAASALLLSACSVAADAPAQGTASPTEALPPAPVVAAQRCTDLPPAAAPQGPQAEAALAQEATADALRVDVVRYPRPSYGGSPWSHWGQGLALPDGRLLTAIGDHRGEDGNSYLLVYDPTTQTMTRVADVQSQLATPSDWGFGKVHGQIVAGQCGEAFLSTYWGTREGLEYTDSYRGDVLFRIDTTTLEMEPRGVLAEERGVPSLAGSPDGRLLYAEAVDPSKDDPTVGPQGAFVVVDATTDEVVFRSDSAEHEGFRNVMVDASGRAYLAGTDGRLLVHEPGASELVTHPERLAQGGRLRASTAPTDDGRVYFATHNPDHLYALEPGGQITPLGPAAGYTTSMAAEPDGSRFYYVPGAHGGSPEAGTPVVAVDTKTGEQTTIVRLDDLVVDSLGLRTSGSYSVVLDADRRLLHVTLNAGRSSDDRWGEVVLAVVHLPSDGTVPSAGPAQTSMRSDGPLVCTVDESAPGGSDADTLAASPPDGAAIAFEDVTEQVGALDPLTGMRGHAVATGDVNADGWPDLFVGTFADRPDADYRQRGASGPAPDRLLLGGPDGFSVDATFPTEYGRTSGAAFADLDADGDLDLVVARNVRDTERGDAPSRVLRNDDGRFVAETTLPEPRGARSVGLLDFDGDGMLDLIVAEDRFSGGSSVLLRNEGSFVFTNATAAAGLPDDLHGLGVGTGDLDGDGDPDILVGGSNRLFLNTGDATFVEQQEALPAWQTFGDEDDPAGVAQADVNGDGRLDVVIGQHFNSTIDGGQTVPVRLYLNKGVRGGQVRLVDVTEKAGLVGLPTKSPHVAVLDIDADGRVDILTTGAGEDGRPLVFRQVEGRGRMPAFEPTSPPTSTQYWVTAATADVDRDGAVDVVAVEWEPSLPTQVWRSTGGVGRSLVVDAAVATTVDVFRAGGAGRAGQRLGSASIGTSTGYAAGPELVARVGVAEETSVDVVLTEPSGDETRLTDVPTNQPIVCSGP